MPSRECPQGANRGTIGISESLSVINSPVYRANLSMANFSTLATNEGDSENNKMIIPRA